MVINQGTLFHCTLSGPITLNGIASFIGNCTISGGMSGTGGFTMLGNNGTYLNMVPGGTVTLHGTNTYTGPTTVFPGTLIVKKAAGLYNGDAAKWTPANITIHKAATLRLNVGGPGEFTGEHVGTLLGNLTRSVNDNGLMGGSFLSLDTANATRTRHRFSQHRRFQRSGRRRVSLQEMRAGRDAAFRQQHLYRPDDS